MKSTKNIVILGAGFGGLKAAMTLSHHSRYLKNKGFNVILVDQNDYHTYTPTLYEIASTSKSSADYEKLKTVNAFPLKTILADTNIEVHKTSVKDIDVSQGKITLQNKKELDYEYLIIALGAQINYFNIPNLEKNALTLKTFNDAIELRDTVFNKACQGNNNERIDIVIGGAGPTGVELTAELQEWFAQLKDEGAECDIGTTLINAAPTILSGFDKRVVHKSKKRLNKLKANVLNKSRIEKVKKDHVVLSNGTKSSF